VFTLNLCDLVTTFIARVVSVPEGFVVVELNPVLQNLQTMVFVKILFSLFMLFCYVGIGRAHNSSYLFYRKWFGWVPILACCIFAYAVYSNINVLVQMEVFG
jgi:hypothetical protein